MRKNSIQYSPIHKEDLPKNEPRISDYQRIKDTRCKIKNIFKVSTIVGVVVFFVPAYSMEEHLDTLGANTTKHYSITRKEMVRDLNLFSEMTRLDIRDQVFPGKFSFLCKDNPLFTDKDLPLPLSVIQAIQSDAEKSSTILERINDAICQEVSLASRYSLTEKKTYLSDDSEILTKVNSSGSNHISIFSVIENCIERERSSLTESIANLNKILFGRNFQSYEKFFSMCYEEEFLEMEPYKKKKKALDDLRSSILKTIFVAANKRKNDIDRVFKKDIYGVNRLEQAK